MWLRLWRSPTPIPPRDKRIVLLPSLSTESTVMVGHDMRIKSIILYVAQYIFWIFAPFFSPLAKDTSFFHAPARRERRKAYKVETEWIFWLGIFHPNQISLITCQIILKYGFTLKKLTNSPWRQAIHICTQARFRWNYYREQLHTYTHATSKYAFVSCSQKCAGSKRFPRYERIRISIRMNLYDMMWYWNKKKAVPLSPLSALGN